MHILLELLSYHMQNHVMMDRAIMALNCTFSFMLQHWIRTGVWNLPCRWQGPWILHIQHCSCWWLGCTRNLGINSHDIDLMLQKYPDFRSWRVQSGSFGCTQGNVCDLMLSSLNCTTACLPQPPITCCDSPWIRPIYHYGVKIYTF